MQQHDQVGAARYWPALDGVRGLAVAAVLCFHGGFAWAEGGYLGVSTFFTLSGFLITTLLLRESAGGRVDLLGFWGRRVRRLMPALLAGMLLAVASAALAAPSSVLAEFRGDVVASLAYVANWRFASSAGSYADLFGAPSPLLHFWSLAIEEQFYVVYPVVFAGAALVARRRPGAIRAVILVLAVLSFGATAYHVLGGAGDDRIYYGTDVRIGEVLIGALLALVVAGSPHTAHRRWVPGVGAGALALLAVSWVTIGLDRAVVYDGGLLVYAVLSALVVLAALGSGGPLVVALSVGPLRALGRISYGVYVYHWPIFLWLDGARTGWDPVPLFALRLVVTLALATASYRFIEQPIRQGRRLRGAAPWVVAPAVAMAAIVWAAAITQSVPAGSSDLDESRYLAERLASGRLVDFKELSCPDGSAVPPPTSSGPRVMVLGDSTAGPLAFGVGLWARCTGRVVSVPALVTKGCGLVRQGAVRTRIDALPITDECRSWQDSWTTALAARAENIVVVSFGPWDVFDRRLPGDDRWLEGPSDPALVDQVRIDIGVAMDRLETVGSTIAWLTTPRMVIGQLDGRSPDVSFAGSEPERVERLNDLVREEASSRSWIEVIELGAYIDSLPEGGLDAETRPDGVHLTGPAARDVVYDWLGEEVLQAWDRSIRQPAGS